MQILFMQAKQDGKEEPLMFEPAGPWNLLYSTEAEQQQLLKDVMGSKETLEKLVQECGQDKLEAGVYVQYHMMRWLLTVCAGHSW